MSIYADHPLVRGEAHIRLLRILPGSSTDDIKCSFSTFDVNAAPKYQALSYEWGSKSHLKFIHILGQQKTVRINLWNFLSRLRSHGFHDYLWCDAICIDQGNDRERNHQVQMMSQIYRKAHSVLVWLGEEYDNSAFTLHSIRLMSTGTDSLAKAACLEVRDVVWEGLAALSERRYWTRIWIIQEITVARNLELFCGSERVPWSAFATTCKFPQDQLTPWATDLWDPFSGGTAERRNNLGRAAGRKLNHSVMYGLVRSQKRWPILVDSFEILSKRYEDSGCEDSRDRIFALLSISKEVVLGRGITVDYQKNIEDTFFTLLAWGGTGPITLDSRIRFAKLTASVMELSWPGYILEARILYEYQRSVKFFEWIRRPLPIALRCRYLGNWNFHQDSKSIGTTNIHPGLFRHELWRVSLPLQLVEPFTKQNFFLFGFSTSNVTFACNPTGYNSWAVVSRAFFEFQPHEAGWNRVPTIFQGLTIVAEETGGYSVKLKNLAQFMEIFLDEIDSSVWWMPNSPAVPRGGAGSLAKKLNNKDDRNLGQVVDSLKITSSLRLEYGVENSETNIEDESPEADWEKLQAESEALGRPRIPGPPVEKPRNEREEPIHRISEKEKFLDPFYVPILESEDFEASINIASPQLLSVNAGVMTSSFF